MINFLKNIFKFKVGRCCADCKKYNICFKNTPYDEMCLDSPACCEFKERDKNE